MKETKDVKKILQICMAEMRVMNLDKINKAVEKVKSLHRKCKGFDSVKEVRKLRQRQGGE
jgi:hypothetical protein